jgi:hypothetical protein
MTLFICMSTLNLLQSYMYMAALRYRLYVAINLISNLELLQNIDNEDSLLLSSEWYILLQFVSELVFDRVKKHYRLISC